MEMLHMVEMATPTETQRLAMLQGLARDYLTSPSISWSQLARLTAVRLSSIQNVWCSVFLFIRGLCWEIWCLSSPEPATWPPLQPCFTCRSTLLPPLSPTLLSLSLCYSFLSLLLFSLCLSPTAVHRGDESEELEMSGVAISQTHLQEALTRLHAAHSDNIGAPKVTL